MRERSMSHGRCKYKNVGLVKMTYLTRNNLSRRDLRLIHLIYTILEKYVQLLYYMMSHLQTVKRAQISEQTNKHISFFTCLIRNLER